MDLSLELQGMDRLVDAFMRLPEATRRRMSITIKKGGRLIVSHARANHRFETRKGRLERAIDMTETGPSEVTVFLNESAAPHARFVHDGTSPHLITPARRQALRWTQGSEFRFARSVLHPGTKPDPFLYQAAEAKAPAVRILIQDEGINAAIREAGL